MIGLPLIAAIGTGLGAACTGGNDGSGGCVQCSDDESFYPTPPVFACTTPADCGTPDPAPFRTCFCDDGPSIGCVHYSDPVCNAGVCEWTATDKTGEGMCNVTKSTSSASSTSSTSSSSSSSSAASSSASSGSGG
jgi:hypothetical protein